MRVLIFILFFSVFSVSQTLNVLVLRVTDGDSFVVQNKQGERIKVRLWGIDAPEMRQRSGPKSARFLATRIDGELIQLDVVNTDSYGRLIVRAYDSKDVYINQELVQLGLAWVYDYYVKDSVPYWYELQNKAQQKRIGLWRYSDPIPPWEFRRKQRNKN